MKQERCKGMSPGTRTGMTLVEVVIALGIAALGTVAIISGYLFTVSSAESSALSLAANSRAMQRLEEVRAAQWDTSVFPAIDELTSTNFPDEVVILDVSGSSSAATYATNRVVISDISSSPPLRRIRVDCTWRFYKGNVLTNTIETCRAADQ
jgi:type II secretory pathway pseudopilin PulG